MNYQSRSGDSMRKTLLSISLLFTVSTANSAEFNIRPGLWEMTTKSDLLALVPRIPADQMQTLTNLAKQYGLDMPKISNGAATSEVCITQEMAKQKIPTFLNQNQYEGLTVKLFDQYSAFLARAEGLNNIQAIEKSDMKEYTNCQFIIEASIQCRKKVRKPKNHVCTL